MNQQMDNQLPEGWVEASLGELNQYQASTVQPEKFAKTTFELYSVPAFPEKIPEILQGESIGSSKQLVLSKDVLICKINPRINRVWVVKDIKQYQQIASSEWIVFRQPALNERYFGYYFQSLRFRNLLCADVTGVGGSLTRAQPKKVATFELPLPPLAEQHYLADKLDSLLARIQTVSEQLAAVPALLKQFRQSVLADAVSGKLINIKSLTYQSLNQCAKIHNGARKPISLKERNKIQGNIPYYGATGVVDYVNGYTHKGRFLLVGEDGANLLSKAKDLAYIVEGEIWVNNHAHVLKEYENYSLDFIKIAINSLNLSNWVTGTAQPKLTKKALESLPIPKFTFAEQTEIVRRVEALFALADQIEQQSHAAAERVALLTRSVLAKAFRGELSAQWRCEHPDLISGDNSAAARLARIQAERAATGKKSRRA